MRHRNTQRGISKRGSRERFRTSRVSSDHAIDEAARIKGREHTHTTNVASGGAWSPRPSGTKNAPRPKGKAPERRRARAEARRGAASRRGAAGGPGTLATARRTGTRQATRRRAAPGAPSRGAAALTTPTTRAPRASVPRARPPGHGGPVRRTLEPVPRADVPHAPGAEERFETQSATLRSFVTHTATTAPDAAARENGASEGARATRRGPCRRPRAAPPTARATAGPRRCTCTPFAAEAPPSARRRRAASHRRAGARTRRPPRRRSADGPCSTRSTTSSNVYVSLTGRSDSRESPPRATAAATAAGGRARVEAPGAQSAAAGRATGRSTRARECNPGSFSYIVARLRFGLRDVGRGEGAAGDDG